MRIVLAEQLNGQPQAERVFESTTFAVGRDDVACQIVFDSANWPMVSRRHAEFRFENERYLLVDCTSRFGTFLDGERIEKPMAIRAGAVVQFGPEGPALRVLRIESITDSRMAPEAETSARGLDAVSLITGRFATPAGDPLRVVKLLEDRPITIGRTSSSDVLLDELQISNNHARVFSTQGEVYIEDSNSTNGVYVNGTRIKQKTRIAPTDNIQIGPFLLRADIEQGVAVFDTRAKTRIDAIDITKIVKNRSGGGETKLLDDVDLAIEPNEFVGLLGPSGAGKSTLMDALNGMRPATGGVVLVNNQDLYEQLDSLKQSIGYVPQDDIIHRELSVYRTLYYVARLRLSRDVSASEIDQIINEVMDVTGLAERRDVPVGQLSGGQRKRVSIAVELITKPSVIFLDEPTSGLDPATEEKIMKLFRHIAESGRTVILTTHAMENVKLFDKIVVLMRGKLVFYGAPSEALAHVKAESFKDLYDKLEAPIDARLASLPPLPANASAAQQRGYKLQKESIAEAVAEEWKQRFLQTKQYRENILEPLGALKGRTHAVTATKHRPFVTDALRQWKTLARRYIEVLRYDKFNLLILFGQAPIVAFLTYLVVDQKSPRDFPYFVLGLVSVWFGTSIAAREIIRERAVYNRERMVNLGLFAYVGSKLSVLSLIVGLQCLLLFGLLRLVHVAGMMRLPGDHWGLPQLAVILIAGGVGIALGLFVSAIVRTSEMATSVVPLLLIPQVIFCGLVGVPKGSSKYVGAIMPATWAFDGLKHWSSDLGVLKGKDEEAMPAKNESGRGLFKQLEHDNDALINKKQKEVEDYRASSEKKFDDFDEEMKDYQERVEKWNVGGRRGAEPKKPEKPELDPVPPQVKVENIPDDLSGYVDFLHPWGGKWFNPAVLLLLFVGLTCGTIIALRTQDIG